MEITNQATVKCADPWFCKATVSKLQNLRQTLIKLSQGLNSPKKSYTQSGQ